MMHITVLTPEKEIFQGEIESVKVPGIMGQFQVLRNHAPIVSALEAGKVTIVTAKGEYRYFDGENGVIKTKDEKGQTISFEIAIGFIEVRNNEISLLVQGVKKLPK